jgi:hypothetical protein
MLYIGPIYKTVMNDLTSDQIGDFENEQRIISRARSILDVGTVSQTVRSGNGSYKDKDHAHPSLYTVFSITQLDHSITPLCFSGITDLEVFF